MTKPYVIMHNVMSLDGHVEGFTPDIGLYYDAAAALEADCMLTGSDTILKAMESEGIGPDQGQPPAPPVPVEGDERQLLVVTDSRGRINTWQALRNAGYWRDVMALVSKATPTSYLEYLKRWHVRYIVAGNDHVNMGEALEELGRMGIRKVRTDSGGTLNGVLLRQGLVDEVSVLLHPVLTGGSPPATTIFRDIGPAHGQNPITLSVISSRRQKNGVVWLRYTVDR